MTYSISETPRFALDDTAIPDNKPDDGQLPTSLKISGQEVQLTPVFFAYWRFAAERQNIFFRRLRQVNSSEVTPDPVLSRFKFTNAYRASDRVSQYLIRNVIYREDLASSDEEVFFRILLFKLFNKIETWEFLEKTFGSVNLRDYNFRDYDTALARRKLSGERIYSAAYIMPSGGSRFEQKAKHSNHLLLLEYMIKEHFPNRLRKCSSMDDAYALLLSAPSLGPFLAYQFATDINYSEITNFNESDFVVAGPGALDGISKCFRSLGKIPASNIIKFMFENQDDMFSNLALDFRSLWGRPLQLVDCQNVFCEISKYARVAYPDIPGLTGRTRIKQKFTPSGSLPAPWYPPKWKLNPKISASGNYLDESPGSETASTVQLTML